MSREQGKMERSGSRTSTGSETVGRIIGFQTSTESSSSLS